MLFSKKTTYWNTDVNFYLLINSPVRCNIYFQLLQLLFYSLSCSLKKKKKAKSDRNNWELWRGGNEISFSYCYPEWHRLDVEAHLWLFPDVCGIVSVFQLFFMLMGIFVKFFVQVLLLFCFDFQITWVDFDSISAGAWNVTKIILNFVYHKHCTI